MKKGKTLNARPPMPWFNVRDMTAENQAPAYVPPEQRPSGPYVQFPAPPK